MKCHAILFSNCGVCYSFHVLILEEGMWGTVCIRLLTGVFNMRHTLTLVWCLCKLWFFYIWSVIWCEVMYLLFFASFVWCWVINRGHSGMLRIRNIWKHGIKTNHSFKCNLNVFSFCIFRLFSNAVQAKFNMLGKGKKEKTAFGTTTLYRALQGEPIFTVNQGKKICTLYLILSGLNSILKFVSWTPTVFLKTYVSYNGFHFRFHFKDAPKLHVICNFARASSQNVLFQGQPPRNKSFEWNTYTLWIRIQTCTRFLATKA